MIASALLILAALTVQCSGKECPVWFFTNNTINRCQCGKDLHGVVDCDPTTMTVSLLYCYCMTYNNQSNETVVGACTAMCARRKTPNCQSFNELQTNETQDLNEEVCGRFNRTGQLCGSCMPNQGPQVYSFSIECMQCEEKDFARNLFKYAAIAFLPLTVFYFFVIILKVSVTSGSMVAYILTCQTITAPIVTRNVIRPDKYHSVLALLISNCFSIWNLDILRSVYSPFCLHPKMNTMHVLALDYLVGVYPLFLIALTYFATTLYDQCPVVTKVCRPAKILLRREWNLRGSLIHAFASFLILSYTKILNVSFDLLFPVYLRNIHGEKVNKTYLYNDAEIEYFGKEHLPFGILAIFMLIVFNIVPLTLLLLYPCQCFQRGLNRCGIRNPILFTFMDAIQGCYRHRPRDCRYFAALYLVVRILQLLTFALVRDYIYVPLMGFYFIALTILLVFIDPYIEKVHNMIDKIFFLFYSCVYFLTALNAYLKPSEPQIPIHKIYTIAISLMSLLPISYGGVMVFKRLIPKKVIVAVKSWCQQQLQMNRNRRSGRENESTPLLGASKEA